MDWEFRSTTAGVVVATATMTEAEIAEAKARYLAALLQAAEQHGQLAFVDVRDPHTKHLLFRYDPDRQLVEIRFRGRTTLVDLTRILPIKKESERP